MKMKSIWIIMKKQTRFLRVKSIRWYLAPTAGIHTDGFTARQTAKNYQENSLGWTYRAVRYNRAAI